MQPLISENRRHIKSATLFRMILRECLILLWSTYSLLYLYSPGNLEPQFLSRLQECFEYMAETFLFLNNSNYHITSTYAFVLPLIGNTFIYFSMHSTNLLILFKVKLLYYLINFRALYSELAASAQVTFELPSKALPFLTGSISRA